MRLIDADALIAEYERVHIGPAGGARKLMVDAPTVDAVEVVRCKDCKYCKQIYDYFRCDHPAQECEYCLDCWLQVNPNDFCSYGERKVSE